MKCTYTLRWFFPISSTTDGRRELIAGERAGRRPRLETVFLPNFNFSITTAESVLHCSSPGRQIWYSAVSPSGGYHRPVSIHNTRCTRDHGPAGSWNLKSKISVSVQRIVVEKYILKTSITTIIKLRKLSLFESVQPLYKTNFSAKVHNGACDAPDCGCFKCAQLRSNRQVSERITCPVTQLQPRKQKRMHSLVADRIG